MNIEKCIRHMHVHTHMLESTQKRPHAENITVAPLHKWFCSTLSFARANMQQQIHFVRNLRACVHVVFCFPQHLFSSHPNEARAYVLHTVPLFQGALSCLVLFFFFSGAVWYIGHKLLLLTEKSLFAGAILLRHWLLLVSVVPLCCCHRN